MPTSAQMLDCPPVRFDGGDRTERDCYTIVGESAPMRRLRLQIERIGPHFRTLLVRGEMGTGKELVARALHHCSGHPHELFTICHAASLDAFFEEDAALDSIPRRLRSAEPGTLFIDSIEEMSSEAQKELLRMLEQRLSGRVIVSTALDLRQIVATGAFRQDLYHRLAMVEIVVEPLRRRPEDIPALTRHFVEKFAALYRKSIDAVDHEAMEMLRQYSWPGNVRELENVICNGVLQCEGTELRAGDLSFAMQSSGMSEERKEEIPARLQEVIDRHVLHVLRECAGNKVRAAEMLGISRSTLYRMLEGCSAQG